MNEFDDIRPYHDSEVAAVLTRLLEDRTFLHIISRFHLPGLLNVWPWLARFLIRLRLKSLLRDVNSIAAFQQLVALYAEKLVTGTTTGFDFSGLESLDPGIAYLFVGNHRDIAGDSMLVNYALNVTRFPTVRIAMGDNLLQRQFATDLMKLNKSFVIKRTEQGKKRMYRALMQTSRYILSSLHEHESIWIAQAAGRAKDGLDRTDPALLKMFSLHARKSGTPVAATLAGMNLVPVSISYEYDPCDLMKAKELWQLAEEGVYRKPSGEDLLCLVKGLSEFKGRISLRFGQPFREQDLYALAKVEDIAQWLDREILRRYRLFPPNILALQLLQEKAPSEYRDIWKRYGDRLSALASDADHDRFARRLASCRKEYQPFFLRMYANPILNQYRHGLLSEVVNSC